MFDESKLDQLLEVAGRTHADKPPTQMVSMQVTRILSNNAELSQFSRVRGARFSTAISNIPMKQFNATHMLVPPVL